MNYISFSFAVTVFFTLILYYLFPQKLKWTVLLFTSMLFYISFGTQYLPYLATTIFTTYLCGLMIEKNPKHKKIVLFLCVVLNIGLLAFLKLFNWSSLFINNISTALNISIHLPFFNLIAPIGISFYTLQAVGYIIDIYRSKITAEKNLLKYTLFISYFPIIIQGPISRYNQLANEFNRTHKFNEHQFLMSLQLILFGLIKKIVIADRLAIIVNNVYADYIHQFGLILYITAILYSIQLYMDFSGCVDICRGVSKLFDIEITNNFSQPYFSRSIKEFWRHWHISLSSWLRDYVYISLGGNRHGTFRKYLNLVITFFVSGLWHGNGLSYIVWGLLHAFYQIMGDLTLNIRNKIKQLIKIEPDSLSEKIYQTVITFHLVGFAWIFFRSATLTTAFEYIKNMFSLWNPWIIFNGAMFNFGVSEVEFRLTFYVIFAIFVIEFFQRFYKISFREKISHLHIGIRWLIYFALIFIIIFLGVYGPGYNASDFIYGGF